MRPRFYVNASQAYQAFYENLDSESLKCFIIDDLSNTMYAYAYDLAVAQLGPQNLLIRGCKMVPKGEFLVKMLTVNTLSGKTGEIIGPPVHQLIVSSRSEIMQLQSNVWAGETSLKTGTLIYDPRYSNQKSLSEIFSPASMAEVRTKPTFQISVNADYRTPPLASMSFSNIQINPFILGMAGLYFAGVILYNKMQGKYDKKETKTSENLQEEPIEMEPIEMEPIKEKPIKQEISIKVVCLVFFTFLKKPLLNDPFKKELIKEEPINQELIKEEPINEEPVKQEYNLFVMLLTSVFLMIYGVLLNYFLDWLIYFVCCLWDWFKYNVWDWFTYYVWGWFVYYVWDRFIYHVWNPFICYCLHFIKSLV